MKRVGTIPHYDLTGRLVVVEPQEDGFVFCFVYFGVPVQRIGGHIAKSPAALARKISEFNPRNVYVAEGIRDKEVSYMCRRFGWTSVKFFDGMDNFVERFIYRTKP